MKQTKWNDGWKFWCDRDSFALAWRIPEEAQDVTIPHDAMIEKPADPNSPNGGNTGFHDGDCYIYVKKLFVPKDAVEQTFELKFEGVYMNAFVYVNQQLAAKNMFGYTTFYVKLDEFLCYGEENEIRVQVRAGAMTNSRWYSGAGIYRDVYLLESGLTYLIPEGVKIKTEHTDADYAVLQIQSEIKNRKPSSADLILETKVYDADDNMTASERTAAVLFGQEERILTQRLTVENPKTWSDETPALYTCVSRLYEICGEEKKLLDETVESFGIRTLQLDAKRGLRVNGKEVKLRGSCIHHDSGLLGAATYGDAQFRQMKKMKEAGFNAVRMSHHPMAPAMLRACDQVGMYVMDETFDMWNRLKSNYDYGLYFEEWWERDVTAMVRNDYNHPSVILYSVGNEIQEIGTDHGAKTCHELCAKIKSLDDTRYTLASINGIMTVGDQMKKIVKDVVSELGKEGKTGGNINDFMTWMYEYQDKIVVHPEISKRLEKACASTDIAGYNYMTGRYEVDGKNYPNRVIVGSETYPPEIARNWDLAEKYPYLIGDFTWTGWDYIGEAGVGILAYQQGEGGFGAKFPAQLAYCGDIEITGFRRPLSYYREIVFGLRRKPYIAVQNPNHYGQALIKTPWAMSDTVSTWNWSGCEGKPVIVEVYTSGAEVELIINGTSIGRKSAGKEVGFRTLFETIYNPGTVEAVAYDDNGDETGRMQLATAAGEKQIILKKEETAGHELIFIDVLLCDNEGNVYTDADCKLMLTVSGGAKSIGFGSGNPKSAYSYNEGVTETFNGRAQIILKRTGTETVKVGVKSEDGAETVLKL